MAGKRIASVAGAVLFGAALAGLAVFHAPGLSVPPAEAAGDGEAPSPATSPDAITGTLAYRQALDAARKEETVYVHSTASGAVQSTEVSSRLDNADHAERLRDRSVLTDIENTEGDEEFQSSMDGMVWDARGEDICYKGKTTKAAPVAIEVTYWLDGEKVAAEDLAGKSGKVKIRYDYTNNARQTRTVNGSEVEMCTPFVCVTGLVLDNDVFRGIEGDNAKVINDGERTIVAGFAVPGMNENLGLGEDVDIDFPTYVEVTAQATDFSLNNALTLVTSGLFDDVDTEELDTDELGDALGSMADAMDRILDASGSLVDGLGQLADGSGKLADGAAGLQAMTGDLPGGAGQLDTGARQLSSGLGQLKDGAGTLSGSLGAVVADGGAVDQMKEGLSQVSGAAGKAADSAKSAKKWVQKAKDAVYRNENEEGEDDPEKIEGIAVELQALAEQQQADGDTEAAEAAAKAARELLDVAGSGATQDYDSVYEYLDAAEEEIESAHQHAAGAKGASASGGTLQDGLSSLKAGVRDAQAGAAELESKLGAAKDGAEQLGAGTRQLAEAMPILVKGIAKVAEGAEALAQGNKVAHEGAGKFYAGLQQFDEQAIHKLMGYYDDNVAGLADRLDAMGAMAKSYDNFSGKSEGAAGSVKFIYQMDSIGAAGEE